ncbi:MAG: type IV secretion system DNA-binding domain-containing protein [Xenococcaceae cyanobacterium MO_188.B29]|nr:type IV secretion system DNA-binding domain-containing protein [Xenococcaceae cyanobacterium MO_188.B29]
MKIGSGFGQEITKNNWEIGFQNFCWLLLVSLVCGAIITLIFFALLAPENALELLRWYYTAWFLCQLPFGCSSEAATTLQTYQPVIHQITGLLNQCKYIFSLSSFGSCLGLIVYFQQQGKKYTAERFLRGAKFLKPEELIAEIDAKYQATEFDLKLGREEIRLPEFLTFRHISFAGASGTGKTQAINSLLLQLQQKRPQKCLILDLNGQYYSRFGREGDVILSLYDKRSRNWNFWSEDAPAEFFSEALIETDGNDKFFAPAGRALLTDLLRINSNIENLWQDLTSTPKDLIKKLKGGISPALLGGEEQAAGVMATASLQLNFLQHLNHWCENREPFRITEWCTNQEENWVFLIVRDRDLAASKPLLRTWIDLATLGVLGREEDKAYPHLWLIADELPGIGKLPTLGKLLSQGRKYRATTLVGYQTSGQLEDIYGKDGAKEILQGLQNKFVFRCGDSDTSKKASLELGEQEIEEISTAIQFGKLSTRDRNGLNRSIKTRPVVMPSEIQNLPDLQAYLKLCNLNPSLIHFDYRQYPQINEPNNLEIPPAITASAPEEDTETENTEPEGTFDVDSEKEETNDINADLSSTSEDTLYKFDDKKSSSNFLNFHELNSRNE